MMKGKPSKNTGSLIFLISGCRLAYGKGNNLSHPFLLEMARTVWFEVVWGSGRVRWNWKGRVVRPLDRGFPDPRKERNDAESEGAAPQETRRTGRKRKGASCRDRRGRADRGQL